jgi:hypothetical protein
MSNVLRIVLMARNARRWCSCRQAEQQQQQQQQQQRQQQQQQQPCQHCFCGDVKDLLMMVTMTALKARCWYSRHSFGRHKAAALQLAAAAAAS